MNKKTMKKVFSFILTVIMLTISITPSFAAVTHYVVEKDGVKYQYAQEDLISSYYGDKKLYNDYISGDLEALLDDKNGYIEAEDVFEYIAATDEVHVNSYTESKEAKVIEVGNVVNLDADGNPIEDKIELNYIASDFNYGYMKYKPVMQSERQIFVITGFSEQGKEKSKTNGDLVIPKRVEVEENGEYVTKSVEGIDNEAFKDTALESVVFPETIGEYDFVINASAFANAGIEEVIFNEGIKAIKEGAFTKNKLTEVYFPSTILTIGNNSFAHNKISNLVFSDDVKAIQIDNYTFYDNELEEVHLPYSIFKFLGYVFKGNPGTELLSESELDANDPEGTGVVQLYTRNPEHLTSDTYIARSKYHNIVNVAEGIDRTDLYSTIQNAKSIVLSDYPQEDVDIFLAKLSAAKDVFKDEKATQNDIDSLNSSLIDDINILKKSGVDKSNLRILIEEAKGYSSEVYTQGTYAVLVSAIEKAEALLLDSTATDEEVEIAEGKIRDAIDSLVVKSDIIFTKEDFTYEGNMITGYSSTGEEKAKHNKNLALPDKSPDGTSIEVIGQSAFQNVEPIWGTDTATPVEGIETVKLPSQLKRIEDSAFKYNSLEEVEFPETLEYIGNLAFNVNLLKSVYLPDSVVELGQGAFSLNKITELRLSPNLTEIKNGAFSRNLGLENVKLYEGLTRIGQSAFIGCPIKGIEFPSTLKTIGRMAFSSTRLEGVHIPSSVEVIETQAFKQNVKYRTLKKVTFEEGLKSIGEGAFVDGMISEVTLPYSLEELGETAFKGNINADKESIIVKLHTTNEEHLNFETPKSKNHQQIILASPEFEFDSSTGTLTAYSGTDADVIIPSEIEGVPVKVIGKQAFAGKGIESVQIPEGVETIGIGSFIKNNLTSVTLPSTVKAIEMSAFANNKSLVEINLNEGLETIGNRVFQNTPLKGATIIIPSTVRNIGDSAFISQSIDQMLIKGDENSASIKFGYPIGNNGFNLKFESPKKNGELLWNSFGCADNDNYVNLGNIELTAKTREELKVALENKVNIKIVGIYKAVDSGMEDIRVAKPIPWDLSQVEMNQDTITLNQKIFLENDYFPVMEGYTAPTTSSCEANNNYSITIKLTESSSIPATYALTFNIKDEFGVAVEGATIQVKDPEGIVVEDLDTVESGEYIYTVSKEGYKDATGTIVVSSVDVETDVTLLDEAVASDFVIDENGVITAYNGSDDDVVIPSEIGGVPVKAIGRQVFMGKGIESVQIPEGVETIGIGSFIKNNLTSVTLPSTVKTIEALAFAHNKSLVEINLNEGLQTIENQVFQGTPLEDATIIIPSTVMNIGNSAFYGQSIDQMLIKGDENSASIKFGYPIGGNGLNIKLESPKKNAEFLWNSFQSGDYDNNVDLGTIELSANTRDELKSALENEVNVKIVGIYKAEDSGAEDIRVAKPIPWDLSQVDMNQDTIILNQKTCLENEQFPEKEGYIAPTPSECTANNYYSITIKLTESSPIPATYALTFNIKDESGVAVEDATIQVKDSEGVVVEDLTAVEPGEYIYTVSKEGYKDATETIVVSSADVEIDVTLFEEAVVSDFVIDENGVITAYNGTETELVIPEEVDGVAVVEIGDNAFDKKDLTSVEIPDTITTIGEYAFRGNGLTSINLPQNIETIKKRAFYGNKLELLLVPSSVKTIGNAAFAKNKIAKLSLPQGLKTIEDGAFQANALTELIIPKEETELKDFTYDGENELTDEVPGEVKDADESKIAPVITNESGEVVEDEVMVLDQ